MSEQTKWTTTPPTIAGWYWWRTNKTDGYHMVWTNGKKVWAKTEGASFLPVSLDFFGGGSGEWQGPLTPDCE